MSRKTDLWQTISLHPLTGQLDTRSRPADIPAGGFRWKQNFAVTPDGKLCRRSGFLPFGFGFPSFVNNDFHRQGQPREPITFQFESTSNNGIRRFYCGTQNGVWLLNEATGLYSQILPVPGSGVTLGATGARWHAAELQNIVVFTNNNDYVYAYDAEGAPNPFTGAPIAYVLPSLAAKNVAAAAVVAQYNGFLLVMNVVQDGARQSSRILWSDLNLPDGFDESLPSSLAGNQDLDYGDDILAAAPLLGALYILTRRSIWRMTVSGDQTSTFAFTKVYSEPKNQTGCIAFPNTLVSTGSDLYYMGRDGIYRYNPYIPAPEREDWMHRADGLIYRASDTQLDGNYCLSPVAEYLPTNREIWFSWASTSQPDTWKGINNWTLVAQIEQRTADIIDHGFTSFVNFRRTPSGVQQCNETQDFIGASGVDWTLKSIGGVFKRDMYQTSLDVDGLPTVDLDLTATTVATGYNSILRGMIPLGLNDREKIINKVLLDHDTNEQDVPCAVQLRIGRALSMVDPNNAGPVSAPLWNVITDTVTRKPYKLLAWQDPLTIPDMQAKNLRPNVALDWDTYWTARFIYFEFTILNQDASFAIGGDTAWQRIDFTAMALPMPG